MDGKTESARSFIHVSLMAALTGLFAFRIAAQLVQRLRPTALLPPFDAWQGSDLGYPVLLASQLAILAGMGWTTVAVARATPRRPSAGRWLLALGSAYFGSMCLRLGLGLTLLAEIDWFAKPLPAAFHMVLAGFVLTLGHYHRSADSRT